MQRLFEEGLPIAAIARQLGRARQTIYNWLSASEPRAARKKRPSKLERFRAYIESRLERFDLPATVLLRELRAQGYEGGISILREAVARIKDHHVRRLVDRFETEPGLQAQMDWASCGTIRHRGRRRRLSLFVLVLGHSRFLWARFVVSERRAVLFELLEAAFRALGGVPRELIVDNLKQVIRVARSSGRPAVVDPAFADFALHWGFEVVACPAYWPRAKGKVERAMHYIKQSFLEGRSFVDLEDLNLQLERWLAEVANVRVHATTGERPVDRLEADRRAMLPVAGVGAYPRLASTRRQVGLDGRICFRGVRYSVDPRIVGRRRVEVMACETTDGRLRLEHEGRVVGRHEIRPRGSPPQDDPQHAVLRRILRARPPRHVRRGRGARFEQEPSPAAAWLAHAPIVAHRPLELYERAGMP